MIQNNRTTSGIRVSLGRVDAVESVEMLVLMNGSGKVERYDLASGEVLA